MAFTISYAEVEATLAHLHGIDARALPAFRSRFGALQRGGLLAKQPGKGIRLRYGPDDFHRVLLAFELVQAGIAPAIILRLINDYWDRRLRPIFRKAEQAAMFPAPRNTNDEVLALNLALLAGEVIGINHTTLDKVGHLATFALESESHPPVRILILNLSSRLRTFHDHVRVLHMKPDELFEMAAKTRKKPKRKMR